MSWSWLVIFQFLTGICLSVCLQIQISSVQNKLIGYQPSLMWEVSSVGTVLSCFDSAFADPAWSALDNILSVSG